MAFFIMILCPRGLVNLNVWLKSVIEDRCKHNIIINKRSRNEMLKNSDEIADSDLEEDVGLTLNNSQVSTLATPFSTSSLIYRGTKGSFNRKHENPRPIKAVKNENDYYRDFVALFSGDDDIAQSFIFDYQKYQDMGTHQGKLSANGIIREAIRANAPYRMLKYVFKLGWGRYQNIITDHDNKTSGGRGDNFVSEVMLNQLKLSFPTEPRFPCGHRRLQIYITDENIKLGYRYMKNATWNLSFYNHMRFNHPDLRF